MFSISEVGGRTLGMTPSQFELSCKAQIEKLLREGRGDCDSRLIEVLSAAIRLAREFVDFQASSSIPTTFQGEEFVHPVGPQQGWSPMKRDDQPY